jgi:hypothetical protein
METFQLLKKLKISIKFQKVAAKKSARLEWNVDIAVKASVIFMKSQRPTQLATITSNATNNV